MRRAHDRRIAAMIAGADFLKLRKKRSTLIWALVLALLRSSSSSSVNAVPALLQPGQYEPAGGIEELHRRRCACSAACSSARSSRS